MPCSTGVLRAPLIPPDLWSPSVDGPPCDASPAVSLTRAVRAPPGVGVLCGWGSIPHLRGRLHRGRSSCWVSVGRGVLTAVVDRRSLLP